MTFPSNRSFLLLLLIGGLFALAALAAGCGDDDDDEGNGDQAATEQPVVAVKSKVPRYANDPSATKDPEGAAALKALPQAQRPAEGALTPNIKGLEGASLAQAIDALSNDVGAFWQADFNAAGFAFEPANQVVLEGQSVDTACGSKGPTDEPGYCPDDNTIILPVGWFEQNAAPIGDYAVAYVIAFMWGLQVESQIGLTEKLTEADQTLVASCLVGNWTASLIRRDALDETDLQEGAQLIANIFEAQNQAMVDAFNEGFGGGQPGACGGQRAGS